MSFRDSPRPSRNLGQSLVEFALVLPIFLAILIGMVDIGRAVWANNAVANAAREAARWAVVHGGTPDNECPAGPPVTSGQYKTKVVTPSTSCPHPSPSREGIREVARSFAIAGGTPMTIEVCYGIDCSGDTDGLGSDGLPATNVRGTPVTVRVTSQVPMIVPQLVGISQIPVSATSTMLVNH
jgi:type II secretory pathway pseudopilin PulG